MPVDLSQWICRTRAEWILGHSLVCLGPSVSCVVLVCASLERCAQRACSEPLAVATPHSIHLRVSNPRVELLEAP